MKSSVCVNCSAIMIASTSTIIITITKHSGGAVGRPLVDLFRPCIGFPPESNSTIGDRRKWGRGMDKAYIHKSISVSVQVANLSVEGQLLFERMFPHADFQGRLAGHPHKVKANLVPMTDIPIENIGTQLQQMHDVGLIIWYEANGEKIIQLVSWWKFQDRKFAHPSKFPAPEGWKDRLRYNDPRRPKILVEENWTGHVPVGRPKKSGKSDPTQDAYIGGLHKKPIQDAEIPPSAYASAFASASSKKTKSLRSYRRPSVVSPIVPENLGTIGSPLDPSKKGKTKASGKKNNNKTDDNDGGNGKDELVAKVALIDECKQKVSSREWTVSDAEQKLHDAGISSEEIYRTVRLSTIALAKVN
jgi:hypothetical protein